MGTFDLARYMDVDRDYDRALESYRFTCPQEFNFAYDVVDEIGRNRDKDALLVISSDGESVTPVRYSQLAARSDQFARGLTENGAVKGDFALIISGRIAQWYDAILGCMKAGVVSLPGTPLLTGKDISYRANYTNASIVISTSEHCEKIDAVRSLCPSLKTFILLDGVAPGWISITDFLETGGSGERDRVVTQHDDMMMGYFTSGTTGHPKLAPRDFAYGLSHAATALFWMDLKRESIHWTLTDTGWAKAAWGLLFPQFLAEATIVLYSGDGFNSDLLLKLIEKLKVSSFCAPPTVYRMLAQEDLAQYDLTSIERSLSAGEPLNPEAIRFWEKHTGTVIADGYGQTETINVIGNFPGKPTKIGSMGRPVPGFEIGIIDETGNELPRGEIGHIGIQITDPHPPGLFHGYQTKHGLDDRAFRHGWYYTGDTATMDEEGYIWFVGRADDLILSAGYRISPFEVESALLEHPAVAESAVVAERHVERGFIVVAHIVLANGETGNDQLTRNIQDHCKRITAPYKYPRKIVYCDSLPKTISGKIRRVELRG